MLVVISKEQLILLLQEEIKSWEGVSGGSPNPNAFSFDPKTTDPQLLKELGYYDDRESWIAGARIKKLREYLIQLNNTPMFTGK